MNNNTSSDPTTTSRTRRLIRSRTLLVAMLLGLWLTSPAADARAQGWPALDVRVGGLVADISSTVRVNGSLGEINNDIDLEDDLGFESEANTFFASGTWRISKRNQLRAGYVKIARDIAHARPAREIEFRDRTFTVNSEVDAFLDSWYLAADYGFLFVANPTTEFGFTIGITLLKYETGLEFTAIAGGAEDVSRDLSDRAEFDAPIPLPGLFLNLRPHPRVELNSAVRLIKASIDQLDGSMWEAWVGGDFKVWKGLGVGAAYYFNEAQLDRDGRLWNGGVEYDFSGPQLYVTFGF